MIWYDASLSAIGLLFVMSLLTTAMQIGIVLETGELIREKFARTFLRLHFGLLAILSAAVCLEMILVIASVEGGLYLDIPALHRPFALAPLLLFLYKLLVRPVIPPLLQPLAASYFVPLLRLLPEDLLPVPLAVTIAISVAAWFVWDSIATLLRFRAYDRSEITRGVLPHIVRSIDRGICVANHSGWILECNPSFDTLSEKAGIAKPDRIDTFESNLEKLAEAGQIALTNLANGRSISTDNGVYLLQRRVFRSGWKKYVQLTLSDVTAMTRTSAALEHENEMLQRQNATLDKALADIELKAIVREREKLCRAAHDGWSQRLAIAGLSIDFLLDQRRADPVGLAEISAILDASPADSPQNSCDLSRTLTSLAETYERLGVNINVIGQANFADREQEALCAILKEALANAVRHAYARVISVTFDADGTESGVTIQNKCLDTQPVIKEGRGLHDMKARARNAGGSVFLSKDGLFTVQVTFPRLHKIQAMEQQEESR